jgi:hypothetical protein
MRLFISFANFLILARRLALNVLRLLYLTKSLNLQPSMPDYPSPIGSGKRTPPQLQSELMQLEAFEMLMQACVRMEGAYLNFLEMSASASSRR